MRKSSEFKITKNGKTQILLIQPEERGFSIWIDDKRRYENQTFNEAELVDRFYYISRQYQIEPIGKAPRWFERAGVVR